MEYLSTIQNKQFMGFLAHIHDLENNNMSLRKHNLTENNCLMMIIFKSSF